MRLQGVVHQIQRFLGKYGTARKRPHARRRKVTGFFRVCRTKGGGGGLYQNGHATGLFKEADKDGGPYGL